MPDLPAGITLVIGATDRGKTTLTGAWAQALALRGARTAVLDSDIGQSEVGPPGTVGLAWASPEAATLHELPLDAAFFVGALTPSTAALEHVAATAQAAARAREKGATHLLVDTPGWVSGPGARRWLVALAQVLRPATVAGVGHQDELGQTLNAIAAATGAAALPLPAPQGVGRKSASLRAMRRLTRLARAFEGAREIVLPLGTTAQGTTATLGATLGTGTPLSPPVLRWAGTTLRLPLIYGEISPDAATLWTLGPRPRAGWEASAAPVAEHLGRRTVRLLSMAAHIGVCLGLLDDRGHLLALGRLIGFDPERAELRVLAPPPASKDRTQLIAFGRFRIGPDNAIQSEVRPGEI